MINFNYFDENKANVLGEYVTHSKSSGKLLTDAWGKPKADLKASNPNYIASIDAPDAPEFDTLNVAPQRSDGKALKAFLAAKNNRTTGNAERVAPALKKVITSAKVVSDKEAEQILKMSKKVVSLPSGVMTLADSIIKHNPNLDRLSITVWITYMTIVKKIYDIQTIRSNDWSAYLDLNPNWKEWARQGLCYFDGRTYEPKPLFLSGNIYFKIRDIQERREAIVAEFSQAYYESLLTILNAAIPAKMTFGGENRLFLSPLDKFWNGIMIKSLADGSTFSRDKAEDIKSAFASYWLFTIDDTNYFDSETKLKTTSYDITQYFLYNKRFPRGTDPIEKATRKRSAALIGMKLFQGFLQEGLSREDKIRIEQVWNSKYNCFRDIDHTQIPIGCNISYRFKGGELELREAQREGVAFFSKGKGLLAYDVGVGKTLTCIASIADGFNKGLFKRPLIVVPNPTYKKWKGEIGGIYAEKDIVRNGKTIKAGTLIAEGALPQYPINDLYNLGVGVLDKFMSSGVANRVASNSISVITFEGLGLIGFNENTQDSLFANIKAILAQNDLSGREKEVYEASIMKYVDAALAKTEVNIEDFGFDAIFVDEAHNFKNLFAAVQGESDQDADDDDEDTVRKTFAITSGKPSNRAIKLFMLNRYIQLRNGSRNTFALTATPFTNSPLEIYSMLSMFGYENILEAGLANINQFFSKFVKEEQDYVWTAAGSFELAPVIRGFNNLTVMQDLIFKSCLYKDADEAKIPRPIQVTLPLRTDEKGVPLPQEFTADCRLMPSKLQSQIFKQLGLFVKASKEVGGVKGNKAGKMLELVGKKEEYKDIAPLIKAYPSFSDPQMNGAVMWAIGMNQSATFSPYLCSWVESDKIDYQKFVASSPKVEFAMKCIASVKRYHEHLGERPSGQVIYSNRGTSFFPLIKDYLVLELGYQPNEVAIIDGGTSQTKKEAIKTSFLNGDVLIIIGSASIREGIDLQERSSVLYDLFLDWRPTDLKQLFGRIIRQGNIYTHGRIVVPLIENSVDIFMWEKLGQKTDRVNAIWRRGNRGNVLKIEELNPEELKMALISSPKELAEMIREEEKGNLNVEYALYFGYVTQIDGADKAKRELSKQYANLQFLVNDAYGSEQALNIYLVGNDEQKKAISEKIKEVMDMTVNFTDNKTIYAKARAIARIVGGAAALQIRQAVDDHIASVNKLLRIERDVLQQYGLTIDDDLTALKAQFNDKIKEIQGKAAKISSAAYFDELIERITLEKAQKDADSKPLDMRVAEFVRLNFLLECNANTGHICTITGITRVGDTKQEQFKRDLNAEKVALDKYKENAAVDSDGLVFSKMALKIMPKHQIKLLKAIFDQGEDSEGEARAMLRDAESAINNIPTKRSQVEDSFDHVVSAHYFHYSSDWYVIDVDIANDMVFCYAILNGDTQMSELGYQSLSELTKSKVELDFYWDSIPLRQALINAYPRDFEYLITKKEPQAEPKPINIDRRVRVFELLLDNATSDEQKTKLQRRIRVFNLLKEGA